MEFRTQRTTVFIVYRELIARALAHLCRNVRFAVLGEHFWLAVLSYPVIQNVLGFEVSVFCRRYFLGLFQRMHQTLLYFSPVPQMYRDVMTCSMSPTNVFRPFACAGIAFRISLAALPSPQWHCDYKV